MTDGQILKFAADEGDKLTPEAFQLLWSEFQARALDLSVLDSVQSAMLVAAARKLSEFQDMTVLQFSAAIWKFAFDEKEKGMSNQDIYNALIGKNIAADSAQMLIATMEPKARELAESFDKYILIGWLLSIAGLLVLLYTLDSNNVQLVFLLWGTILISLGVIRLIKSYSKKKRYQTILRNMEAEREIENNLYQ